MRVSEVCKNYFNGFHEILNCKNNSPKINALALLKILSYFTLIIPLGFGAVYGTASLYGRISKKTNLSKQDHTVQEQAKKIIVPKSPTAQQASTTQHNLQMPPLLVSQKKDLDALNSTFEASLAKAEEIFAKFDTIDEEEKKLFTPHLKAAYSKLLLHCDANGVLPEKLQNAAARLFYLHGKNIYGGKMEASYQMAQLSLMMSFVQLKAIDAKHLPAWHAVKDLEELPKFLSEHLHAFDSLHEFLKNSTEDALVSTACAQDSNQAFEIAMTLYLLGGTCQNMDKFHGVEHCAFFEKTYGLVKAICERINTPDSQWQIAQVIYNTERFVHYMKCPGDVIGALASLKKLEPYLKAENNSLRARVLSAQIHNICAIEYAKINPNDQMKLQLLLLQYGEFSKASEVASTTEGFNPFLKTMFIHNRARGALKCAEAGKEVAKPEAINAWIQEVLTTIQKQDYNHYYHADFCMTAASFAAFQNDHATALKHLDQADIINLKYAESSQAMQAKAAELRQEITKKAKKHAGNVEKVE